MTPNNKEVPTSASLCTLLLTPMVKYEREAVKYNAVLAKDVFLFTYFVVVVVICSILHDTFKGTLFYKMSIQLLRLILNL